MEIVLNVFRPFRSLWLVLTLAAAGCHAQTPAATSGGAQPVQVGVKLSPEMARRIEVMILSKSQIPATYTISIGDPVRSDVPGYDQIVVTFTDEGKSSRPVTFLLSADGKTLAQFNKFDISQDPKDKVSDLGRPARGGPPSAPVLVVGFDDLECPFCAQIHAKLFPAIMDRYQNQVRIVYRDFPLFEIHPWAMRAAVDANCLGAASTAGYWNYVDYVHAHSGEIGGTEKSVAKANQMLDQIALDEGLRQKVNQPDLAACVQKQDETKVRASLKDGESLGVSATPTLFVNGEKIEDVLGQPQPMDYLYRIIDRALIAAGQTPPPAPPPAVVPVTITPATAKPGS